jgi:hypothetical protein
VTPLIDVMIAGAQKAGTTSLAHYLGGLPSIVTHPDLEFPWFVNPDRYGSYEEAFRQHYRTDPQPEQHVLAKSVGVMFHEKALHRLYDHNSGCRVVVILRDPVDRAWSAYWYLRRVGIETAPTFEQALGLETIRLKANFEANHHLAYRGRGDYLPQLRRLHSVLSREQVYVCLFDDLQSDASSLCAALAQWLDVDTVPVMAGGTGERHNEAAGVRSPRMARVLNQPAPALRRMARWIPPRARALVRHYTWDRLISANEQPLASAPLSEETEQTLRAWFRPRNEALADYLGRDISAWWESL